VTDRLASCKDSPTGKHEREPAIIDGKARCRFCGVRARVSITLDKVMWEIPDDRAVAEHKLYHQWQTEDELARRMIAAIRQDFYKQ
jgi:hypothetical protein